MDEVLEKLNEKKEIEDPIVEATAYIPQSVKNKLIGKCKELHLKQSTFLRMLIVEAVKDVSLSD